MDQCKVFAVLVVATRPHYCIAITTATTIIQKLSIQECPLRLLHH